MEEKKEEQNKEEHFSFPETEEKELYSEEENTSSQIENLESELLSQLEEEEPIKSENPFHKKSQTQESLSPTLSSIKETLDTHTKALKEALSLQIESSSLSLHETIHDIAFLKSKLSENKNECSSLTTCNECASNPSCGWCPLSNSCVEGTEYGPIDESECSVYEYDKCSSESDCTRYQSCDSCINDVACAWCNDDFNGIGCIDQINDKCPSDKRYHLWDSVNFQCPYKERKFLGLNDNERIVKEFDIAPRQKHYIEREIEKKKMMIKNLKEE